MRVQIPCLPLADGLNWPPIVKRRSHIASTEGFRVRVLVGVLNRERGERKGFPTGDGNRLEAGRANLKSLAGSIPAPSASERFELPPIVKRKSRLGPNEAVRVRFPV